MKITNYGKLNKIAKGTLAIVLAGSFTFSASQAFADTSTTQNSSTPVVDLQSGTATDASATTNTGTTTAATGTTAAAGTTATTDAPAAQTTDKQDAPSLLPGDFFYFAKIAFEKIQLALTFDKVKDAQLMASFAQERLAEAQALFASGNQDEALKTIQAALEDMKNANQIVDPQKEEESTTDQAEKDDQATSDQATKAVNSDNQNMEAPATGDTTATSDQNTTNNQTTTDKQTTDQQQPAENKDVQEVRAVMAQNIIALQAALDKVKNPVAKAALQRNIDKAYAKLAEKMDKIESHLEHAKKEDSDKDQNSNEQDQKSATQENTTTPKTDTTPTTGDVKVKGEDQKDNKDVKSVVQTKKVDRHEEKKKEVKVTHKAVKYVQEHHEFKNQMKHNLEENKHFNHEKQNEDSQSNEQNDNEQD